MEDIPGPSMYYFSNMGLGFNQRNIQNAKGTMLNNLQSGMPQYKGSYSPSNGWRPSKSTNENFYNKYQSQTNDAFNR
jgi:hypothetical protein